LDFFGQTLC